MDLSLSSDLCVVGSVDHLMQFGDELLAGHFQQAIRLFARPQENVRRAVEDVDVLRVQHVLGKSIFCLNNGERSTFWGTFFILSSIHGKIFSLGFLILEPKLENTCLATPLGNSNCGSSMNPMPMLTW